VNTFKKTISLSIIIIYLLTTTIGLGIFFLQAFPDFAVSLFYPKSPYGSATITKTSLLGSKVAYVEDYCSGVACPTLSCYTVILGYPIKTGYDHGIVRTKPDINFESCKINNII
jgi:hypothetical protein